MKEYLLLLLLICACTNTVEPAINVQGVRFCKDLQNDKCIGQSEFFSSPLNQIVIAIDYTSNEPGEVVWFELLKDDIVIHEGWVEIPAESGTIWEEYSTGNPLSPGVYAAKVYSNDALAGKGIFILR